jgi:8-oxo-dGTP pyrophosphatase MutT (NUDIX family)
MITREVLLNAFQKPLPGKSSHDKLMSYHRPDAHVARLRVPSPKESAVIMLLFERKELWHTLFIERPTNQSTHSGQLAFPGGKLEANETHAEAALRETFEEVGIEPQQLEIIGQLTELYIPPSNYIVKPFVAIAREQLAWTINPSEVVRTLEVPLQTLMHIDALCTHTVELNQNGTTLTVNGFLIEDKVLWGATAMMLQEFRQLLEPS